MDRLSGGKKGDEKNTPLTVEHRAGTIMNSELEALCREGWLKNNPELRLERLLIAYIKHLQAVISATGGAKY